jgi:hypothetical protein
MDVDVSRYYFRNSRVIRDYYLNGTVKMRAETLGMKGTNPVRLITLPALPAYVIDDALHAMIVFCVRRAEQGIETWWPYMGMMRPRTRKEWDWCVVERINGVPVKVPVTHVEERTLLVMRPSVYILEEIARFSELP